MLQDLKEYKVKRKSVVGDKIIAIMKAWTEDERVLNMSIDISEGDFLANKDEITDDWKYFWYLALKSVVDLDIQISNVHTETPDWFDVDINTSVGSEKANYPDEEDLVKDEIVDSDIVNEEYKEDKVEDENKEYKENTEDVTDDLGE